MHRDVYHQLTYNSKLVTCYYSKFNKLCYVNGRHLAGHNYEDREFEDRVNFCLIMLRAHHNGGGYFVFGSLFYVPEPQPRVSGT